MLISSSLNNLHLRPHRLQLRLELLRLLLLHVLLDHRRRSLHQLLRLLQPQRSRAPHLLDHLDLPLGIKTRQLQIEGCLFHDLLYGLSRLSSSIVPPRIGVIVEAEVIPDPIHQLLHLEHVQPHYFVGELVYVRRGKDAAVALERGEGNDRHLLPGGEVLRQYLVFVVRVVVVEGILPRGARIGVFVLRFGGRLVASSLGILGGGSGVVRKPPGTTV
mmetsp:Transcript_42611/g.90617  ORF Transcript_42611/g.90617 Transcript_42611/m.90617 type:complete len:217 (+) Transcript_42611:365-1015(+)